MNKDMKKVLIIEDDEEIQKRIDYQLNSEKDRVLIIKATSAIEGEREVAIHSDVDLVVLDGCLYGDHPDGLELIPEIRAHYPAPRPILAISKSDYLRQMMMERGCTHECKKNFIAGTILRILGIYQ